MALIHGSPVIEWEECIRPDTIEYSRFKPPYPRWKIGCGSPPFALASRACVDFASAVRSIAAQPWSKAAKALYLSGRIEDSLSPDKGEGGRIGQKSNIVRPISPKKNFKKSKPKRKKRKVTYKRNTEVVKTWAEREEEKFRETHIVREFTDLDGSKFAAWVPRDTSDKEALTAAFENSLAGHRQGRIKEQLIKLMKDRLETYEDNN